MLRSIPASSQLSLGMHPIPITTSSEDNQHVDANVMLQRRTVRVQAIYHKEYVVAVRHDQRWEIFQYWLAVLFQDVQVEVHYAKFLRQKVALQWLRQTSYPLTYTPGDARNGNSLKSILT